MVIAGARSRIEATVKISKKNPRTLLSTHDPKLKFSDKNVREHKYLGQAGQLQGLCQEVSGEKGEWCGQSTGSLLG